MPERIPQSEDIGRDLREGKMFTALLLNRNRNSVSVVRL